LGYKLLQFGGVIKGPSNCDTISCVSFDPTGFAAISSLINALSSIIGIAKNVNVLEFNAKLIEIQQRVLDVQAKYSPRQGYLWVISGVQLEC
jgi:hypothetical protein